jgi:hypothetical protein
VALLLTRTTTNFAAERLQAANREKKRKMNISAK